MWKVEHNGDTGDAHFSVSNGERMFVAMNEDSANWLAELLNLASATVVRLYCRTTTCRGVGGWVERSTQDVKKGPTICDDCGRPMTSAAKL